MIGAGGRLAMRLLAAAAGDGPHEDAVGLAGLEDGPSNTVWYDVVEEQS